MSKWRTLIVWVVCLLLAYTVVAGMVWSASGTLMFQPPRGVRQPENVLFVANGPDRVAVVYMPLPDSPFTLLYCHGNAEDLGTLMPALQQLHARGYAVIAWDYPGYGLSTGRCSEGSAIAAAEAVYVYSLKTLGVNPTKLFLYGRSIGSGVSSQLALRVSQSPAGLILESAFLSILQVAVRCKAFPIDRFDNAAAVSKLRLPLLCLHGTADGIVPFRHGEALYNAATDRLRMKLWVPGAGHNDLVYKAGDAYWEVLERFCGLCA